MDQSWGSAPSRGAGKTDTMAPFGGLKMVPGLLMPFSNTQNDNVHFIHPWCEIRVVWACTWGDRFLGKSIKSISDLHLLLTLLIITFVIILVKSLGHHIRQVPVQLQHFMFNTHDKYYSLKKEKYMVSKILIAVHTIWKRCYLFLKVEVAISVLVITKNGLLVIIKYFNSSCV